MQDTRNQVGPYGLVKRLGEGPHGRVWLAREDRPRAPLLALKLLHPAFHDDPAAPIPPARRARLEADLAALRLLAHPGLVIPEASGVASAAAVAEPGSRGDPGEVAWLASEFVEGPDLYRFSARAAWSTILEVVVSLLRALEALHQAGRIHGHVVTENVIVAGQGPRKSARLLDPGLLLEVFETRRQGVHTSLAPEVLRGEPIDARADLYDLGVLLYECATRAPPFPREDAALLRAAHLRETPRPARELKRSVPVAVESLIDSLLKKDPADRPPSANAAIRELNRTASKRFSTEASQARRNALLVPRWIERGETLSALTGAVEQLRASPGPRDPGWQPAPGVLAVSCDAGQGRTRLLRELHRRLPGPGAGSAPPMWLAPARPTLESVLEALEPGAGDGEEAEESGAPAGLRGALAAQARFLRALIPAREALSAATGETPDEGGGLRPSPGAAPPLLEGERERMLDAAVAVLLDCARVRPLVLAIDDAHAAEPLLIDALRLLARDLAQARSAPPDAEGEEEKDPVPPPRDAPILVVLALSREELLGRPAEASLGALLGGPGVRELPLAPLDGAQVATLLGSALGRDPQEVRGLTARLVEAAGGVPGPAMLLLGELAEAGALQPPDGAWSVDEARVEAALAAPSPADVLARRLVGSPAGVPELARAIAATAVAAPGAAVDAALVADGLGLAREEALGLCRELERRGLLDPFDPSLGHLRLAGGSWGEALLPPVEAAREGLHAALGRGAVDLVGRRPAGESGPLRELAARHLLLGGPRVISDAVPWALQAAAAAIDRRDATAALSLLEPTLRLLEEAPGPLPEGELPPPPAAREGGGPIVHALGPASEPPRVEAHLLHAEALLAQGRPGPARTAAQKAHAEARAGRLPRGMVRSLLLLHAAELGLGEAQAARGHAEEAVRAARGAEWRRGLVLGLKARAAAEALGGEREESLASLDEAREQAELRTQGAAGGAGDRLDLADALRAMAALRADGGELALAGELLERALELDEEGECAGRLATSLRLKARLLLERGEQPRAEELARRAIDAARDALDGNGVARGLSTLAAIRSRSGDLRAARRLEEAALALHVRAGAAASSGGPLLGEAETRLRLGRALVAAGALGAAEQQLAEAARTFKHLSNRARTAEVNVNLALAHMLRGDLARARDAADRALEEAKASGSPQPVQEVQALRAELLHLLGDLPQAEELARAAAEGAARGAQAAVECQARILLGRVHLRRGRPLEAERELREAFDLARQRGEGALMAQARLGIAMVHLLRGEPAGTLGELEKARDVAQKQQDVRLEVLALLALGRAHLFLGQSRRALTILEMARDRSRQVELGLLQPEAALLKAEAVLHSPQGSEPASLAEAAALLEEAERQAAQRRGLRAEIDLCRAVLELGRGDLAAARDRAEAALEAGKLAGDALVGIHAELLLSHVRRGQGRFEEALASAERALGAAEAVRDGESRAEALLERGQSRHALGQVMAAAHDLREAASHVRGIWAALPEELRGDYQQRGLVKAIAAAAAEVALEVEKIASAPPPPTPATVTPSARTAPASAATGVGGGASADPRAGGAGRGPAPVIRDESSEAAPPLPLAPTGGPPGAADSLESLRDPLTNLFNHTFFTAQLETEIKRAVRHSRPLALLKVNIDRFKLVRELYGPKTGKKIIREVATLLTRNVRDVDIVARYFGDEFEVLLPDTDQRGALLTAERIRTAVEAFRFEHEDEKIELTLTIGIAVYPRDAKDRDSLICRTDEALYNARSRGSNTVFSFGGAEGELPVETAPELRELDALMLSREGRTILSMVSRLVNQELDIDRLIELITGMVVEATRGERGFLLLKGPGEEFSFRHGRGIDDKVINSPELKISNSIALDVAKSGRPVHVSEAIEDDRFRDFKSVMDLNLRSIICAPIALGDEVLGVMYVDHNQVARNFSQEDLNFLVAISEKVAIPLKNSKKLRETEDRLAMAEARLKSQSSQLQTKYRYDTIIGRTEAMQKVFKLLDRIVETNHSVVIHGESGTGKELIARAIHYNGPRKARPFVAENCAALSETLLEAELFGHVKGAFTGADRDSKGLFELANGGTLFLDEIGDMSERMQKKLLRVLQEGEVRPVGGKRVFHVDVRIISASNKDLKALVAERKFREDLFYRLNVITVNLPGLRERRDDIVLLVDYFMKKHAEGGQPRELDRETLRALINYDWPGNVRELENEVNRLVAMSDELVTPDLLSPKIREGTKSATSKEGNGLNKYFNRSLKDVEHEFMRDIILHTLEETNWHRTKAAKILKVPTSTLFNKMKKYGIG